MLDIIPRHRQSGCIVKERVRTTPYSKVSYGVNHTHQQRRIYSP